MNQNKMQNIGGINKNELQKTEVKYAIIMRHEWKWNSKKGREICNAYEVQMKMNCKNGNSQCLWGTNKNEMQESEEKYAMLMRHD